MPASQATAPEREVLIRAVERAQLRCGRPVRAREILPDLTPADRAAVPIASPNGLSRRLAWLRATTDGRHGRHVLRGESAGHALWSVCIHEVNTPHVTPPIAAVDIVAHAEGRVSEAEASLFLRGMSPGPAALEVCARVYRAFARKRSATSVKSHGR